MELRDVARLRLRNQRVSGAKLKSAEEAVGWLGCVQSQEYPVAKWTLGMRVRAAGGAGGAGGADGLHDADIDAALWDGRILRTHILRPTWHFVLPADIRWMMALTGPRVMRVIRSTPALQVPDESVIRRSLDVIRVEMAGGVRMTRKQIAALLVEQGHLESDAWLVPVFIHAELDLVLASGGLLGKQQTYALLDETAPVTPGWTFDRDWALAELTRRYFTSHGPAAIADFTWWSSLTVADTKRGLEINGRALQRVDVDGTDHWWAGDLGDADDPSPTVHLMQGYDEFIVAYRSPRLPINLSGLIPPAALSRPPLLHAIVLDGQGVGFWRRAAVKSGFEIETKLARDLSAREQRALRAAVDRHAEFLAQPVTLMS